MSRKKYWLLGLLTLLLALWSIPAAAEEEEIGTAKAEDGVIYKKKTVYNFEDDTITGDLTRPDQEFLSGRIKAQHKSLIKVREDFRDKVLQSVGDL